MRRAWVPLLVVLVSFVPASGVMAGTDDPVVLTPSLVGDVGVCTGEVSYMVDGDGQTVYYCTSFGSNAWLVFDAGEGASFGYIRLLPYYTMDCGPGVQVSPDGAEWWWWYGYGLNVQPVTASNWAYLTLPPSTQAVRLTDEPFDEPECSNPGKIGFYEVEAYEASYLGVSYKMPQISARIRQVFASSIVSNTVAAVFAVLISMLVIRAVVFPMLAGRSRGVDAGGGSGGYSGSEPGDLP